MTSQPPTPSPIGGADLLRSIGLSVDGPVLWGRPVSAGRPGVFVVELPAPQATVSIDQAAIRAWLERVPDLLLDGARPTVGELQARLASFWLPAQAILYVGSSSKSVAARLSGMYKTPLGDRHPQSAGFWLKTLHDLSKARIWWADSDDAELYQDAALDEFLRVAGALPFAVLSTPSGVRKNHGIAGALREEEATGPAGSPADARSRQLLAARADRLGVRPSALVEPAPDDATKRAAARAVARAASAPPKTPAAPRTRAPAASSSARPSAIQTSAVRTPKAAQGGPPIAPTYLSAGGLAGLQSELENLTAVRRPEVLGRLKAARELGDLSENGDYEAARKEQSFLEGRVQQLEQLIKYAVVIDESLVGHEVVMGSTVVVDTDRHGEETFAIVGSAEADAAAGKISYTSPIGRALMGKRAGDTVQIQVPSGKIEYRIVEVR